MTKKQRTELIEFVERFAKGRWTELEDGTIEVIGNFDCFNNQLTSFPDNIGQMKIGGSFYCFNNQLTSLPDSIGQMKIGGSFYCFNNQLTSLPDNIGQMKIGGSFYCSKNQLTSLPDSIGQMKIGGHFYCFTNQLTSLPDSIGQMKIGGDFDCSNNQLTSLPDSIGQMKIGGDFDCSSNQLTSDAKPSRFDEFEVGNDYIYSDGILSELVSTRKKGNLTLYYCTFGVVASDGEYHAHGKTLRQAVSDLNFKKSDRNADTYRHLDLDIDRPVEDVTVIYRTITGACAEGCEMFTSSAWTKAEISIRKGIELTANQYGGKQFAAFYNVEAK